MDMSDIQTVRILFIADTHLGYDLTLRPRIKRRRRGPEFFANLERALAPALKHEVDCVLHGGDLLYRSKVPPRLVEMAFEPLKRVADQGVPVYLVPGNHERSAIPHGMYAIHPKIHIFDRPQTFLLRLRGFTLALAGFPFVRHNIRNEFSSILEQTDWQNTKADGYVLCIHQSIEGARVGPVNYTFRHRPDVIKATDIPRQFTAVLAGHIHRFQILTRDLRGNSLPVPILYPGSIERTSFAEKDERKGFLTLDFQRTGPGGCRLERWIFHDLPARPMRVLELHASHLHSHELKAWIIHHFEKLPEDSVVKLKIHGKVSPEAGAILSAPSLRSLAPPSMNVTPAFIEAMRPFEKTR
jgi:DNA repair exonuclease SbcCD nuclease subunit